MPGALRIYAGCLMCFLWRGMGVYGSRIETRVIFHSP